jgi:peroxiredoxin
MTKKLFHIIALITTITFWDASTYAQTSAFVSAEDAAKTALNVGAKAPEFELKDSNGQLVKSKDLLKQGNLVLTFYRGSWCPFCNTYLRKLGQRTADIKAAGGQIVAISVENPDASLAVAKKNEVLFPVLSDPNLDVARKFGIVYQMKPETAELYKKNGLDVARHNAMPKPELPLAVTYIIDKKGIITYAFIETDYRKRSEPDVIIEQLKKLKN